MMVDSESSQSEHVQDFAACRGAIQLSEPSLFALEVRTRVLA